MTGLSYKNFFNIDSIFKQIKDYLPEADKDRFLKAFQFAEEDQPKKIEKKKKIIKKVEAGEKRSVKEIFEDGFRS